MLEEYNILIIWQTPRSPYTNVLDLGVWCSLQAKVEREHYMKRCEVEALVTSVKNTWNNGYLDDIITNVFNRIQNVLSLIIEANGGNDLVETKRGKKFRNMDLPREQGDVQPVTTQATATTAPTIEPPPESYDLLSDEDDDVCVAHLPLWEG